MSQFAINPEQPSPWKDSVQVTALTDIGMRRAINQDSMKVLLAESAVVWQRQGHLFLVADGMGAHAAGELASKLAVDLIPLNYSKYRDLPSVEALHRAITETNAEIFRRGHLNFEFRSMGTTCCALTLLPEGAVVGHVGDSRVYMLNGDRLYQLTFDHSLVWEMQATGRVSEEAIRSGVIPKNVITRSLGPNPTVHVDLEGPFPIRPGDRFLLCSDGLSGQIDDDEIAALMLLLPPDEAAQLFIDLSNLRGGPDNITAIVVEVVSQQIATVGGDSLALSRGESDKPFSRALGLVAGICLLAALGLAAIQQYPLAVITSILGLIALVTGITQYYLSNRRQQPAPNRYGAGPHRQFQAKPTRELFENLAETMKPLREASEEHDWDIDWAPVDQQFAHACELADSKNYADAIRTQSRLLIHLMHQVRRQRIEQIGEHEGDQSHP
ncbi:MAG: serine/threonine-protein phosphatase [Pirellulaceae bacterium]|nr:serine/threonine-protein phosphatase [Pirellulaceae bacterium]